MSEHRVGRGVGEARLVAPSPAFAASFADALREGFRRGNRPVATRREAVEVERHFARYLRRRHEEARRIVLPDGTWVQPVPFSLHWLVLGAVFVGELSFRHRLNEHLCQSGGHLGYGIRPSCQGRGFGKRLLALGLDAAHRQGLDRVLVTCHDHNLASAAVIEANGGVLQDVVDDIFGGGSLRRYWIEPTDRPWRA